MGQALTYHLPIDSVPEQRVPLSIRQVEDLFALVDWRIVMLDPQVSQARLSKKVHPVSMLRALALPFLIKIPNEMALIRVLEERRNLRRVCMLGDDKDSMLDRGRTWRFRRYPQGFYSRVMLKLLVDMALSTGELNPSLPFVSPLSTSDTLSFDGQYWRERIGPFEDVEIWTTAPHGKGQDLATARKTFTELAKEIQAIRMGFSTEIPLPAKIRANAADGTQIRFIIDRPDWLDPSKNRRLFGADTATNVGFSMGERQTGVVCNVLVLRKVSGRKQVLLSKRLSGIGSGTYILPGGRQREGETLERCAYRELGEETGLRAQNSRPISFFRMKLQDRPQAIVIGVLVDEFTGTVSHREPDQNTDWTWYDLNSLPSPLFESAHRIIEAYKKGDFRRLTWNHLEAEVAVETLRTGDPAMTQLDLFGDTNPAGSHNGD